MSNISKAIAVLGVVAGLGAAALPLSSYAVTAPVEWKGDGAGGSSYGTDADGKKWVAQPVGVQLKIEEGLQISTSNNDGEKVSMAQDATNKDIYMSKGFKVNVVANNNAGYVLSIKGSGTETADDATVLTNESNNTIAAMTGAAGPLALTADGKSTWAWGKGSIAEGGAITEATQFQGVTSSYQSVTTGTTTGAAGTDTAITFGAKIADGQEAGTYTGQVTFMATAGAAAANPTN